MTSHAAVGHVLRSFGGLLYAIGAVAVVGILAAGHKAFGIRPTSDALLAIAAMLCGLLAGAALLFSGRRIHFHGKQILARHRAAMARRRLAESEPIVLYLRSTRDDPIMAETRAAFHFRREEFEGLSTEEEQLAAAVSDFGELTAIDPPKASPNVGATRYEAEWEEWREAALTLMYHARLVVIRAGDGRWLWWEIVEAWKLVKPERLVIMIPADPVQWERFRRRLEELGDFRIPEFVDESAGDTSIAGIVHFTPAREPRVVSLARAGARANAWRPLTPPLRIALRPVHEQLNVRWTLPPIAMQAIAPMLFWGWFGGISVVGLVFMAPLVVNSNWRDAPAVTSLSYVMTLFLSTVTIAGARKLWRGAISIREALRQ